MPIVPNSSTVSHLNTAVAIVCHWKTKCFRIYGQIDIGRGKPIYLTEHFLLTIDYAYKTTTPSIRQKTNVFHLCYHKPKLHDINTKTVGNHVNDIMLYTFLVSKLFMMPCSIVIMQLNS